LCDVPVALLTIPGALDRTRIFDVDVQLLARVPNQARQAELGLSLEVDVTCVQKLGPRDQHDRAPDHRTPGTSLWPSAGDELGGRSLLGDSCRVVEPAGNRQTAPIKPIEPNYLESRAGPSGSGRPGGFIVDVAASVFKAYDIRGVVGQTIDEQFAEHLGRAFGSEALAAGEKAVAVGRDGRVSGPALSAALMRGLASTGVDVVDLGAVTTPMLYYVAATRGAYGCRSGIQITGSHNPKDYNGFKMVLGGRAIFGADIQRLRERIEAEDYQRGRGRTGSMDITEEYTARIVGDCRMARPLKIVVDSGNGIPGATAPGTLRALGCHVVDLYSQVDGDFPNHHPDPSKPENLQDLRLVVRATQADLGLAFDGDGDRLGIVTRHGHIIYPDRQIMLFARDVLKRHPGAPIIFDVKCSQRVPVAIREAGGKPVMWKTGHSLIKAKLKEMNSPFAGEMSGHIFFGERWYGFDDAMYTAARLLEIVSRYIDPSAVLEDLPASYSTPELNVPCAEGEHHRVVSRLLERARSGELRFAGGQICDIDGLRVDFADGFGLIRASNTTPVLVLRFEGHTEAALGRIERDFMSALRSVKSDAMVQTAAH
jgi:phosphomannomutase